MAFITLSESSWLPQIAAKSPPEGQDHSFLKRLSQSFAAVLGGADLRAIYHGHIWAPDLSDGLSGMTPHERNSGFVEYSSGKEKRGSVLAPFPALNSVEGSREELLLIDIDSQMESVNSW